MEILIPTITVFIVAIVIMSVGVLFKRKPLAGSCGGIASLMGSCDVCDLRDKCIEKNAPQCDEHKDCADHVIPQK
jgi:uncharacterized protein